MPARRVWIWTIVGLAAFLVVAVVLFVAAVPLSADALRHRMIRALSERLDADVTLGDLHWRLFPTLHASGSDLAIRRRGRNDAKPLIAIRRFTVDARVAGLIRKHVAHVTIDDLDIEVPPDNGSDRASKPQQPAKSPAHGPTLDEGVIIDTLDANGGQVAILSKHAEKAPNVWTLHAVRLHNVGVGQSMPFEATLTNAIPPGEIDTAGRFGPWQPDTPGQTPLDGTFTFARADLSIFHGISGTLSSKGSFRGTLERLDVTGDTDTPDFSVKLGGHTFPLHAQYHTLIDGTNGDTILERIDAKFLESSLTAKGSVVDAPRGVHGRIVALDVVMDRARIEDVIQMAVKSAPPIRGGLRLTTKFLLPPGETDVADRLRLDGQFVVARARFANYDVQRKIDELSRRGRGKPGDEESRVVSDFAGRFKLGDGRLSLPALTFSVPGAKVELAGRYTLKPETLDFSGRLLMDAKISETQTGVKSLLLKVVDPLFKRHGGGSTIPIHVRGPRSNPDFGIDIRRVFRRGDKS